MSADPPRIARCLGGRWKLSPSHSPGTHSTAALHLIVSISQRRFSLQSSCTTTLPLDFIFGSGSEPRVRVPWAH